jgi:hypothetical protein
MKKTYTLTLAALLLAGSVHARTWTSAEGGKKFQGEYVSHTGDVVTVKKGFKTVRFKISLLSEDDSKWLAEQKANAENENKPEAPEVDAGKIGKKLAGNMVKLTGDKYEDAPLATAPEYFLIYFTASW